MNILLVEDDLSSRTQLGIFLREVGHHVVECSNGLDALTMVKATKTHLLLSDVRMPIMSGIELLQAVKSLPAGQEIDVILFTGYGDMESAIEALRAGASDYLLKPINVAELMTVIDRLAEHRLLRREHTALTKHFKNEVEAATEETRQDLHELKNAFARLAGAGEIYIFSDKIRMIYEIAFKFHKDRTIPVLIQGETGTGKEMVAKVIHFGNSNIARPFVDINCAALTPSIFESELFGYDAGAFSGGLPKGQKGKLDIAQGGTIFLDEITEMSNELQAKLLRVIQEKEFYRVGGLKKIKTDIRVVCATNVNIEERVKEGYFRKDLYYRLNVGRIVIPPLRERTEEILPLAETFLRELSKKRRKRFRKISGPAARILTSYRWPGNIRELKNVVELVTLVHDDVEMKSRHLNFLSHTEASKTSPGNTLPAFIDPVDFSLPPEGLNLQKYIDEIVQKAYEMHKGNKTRTARFLGISRSSLYCHLNRLNLCSFDK